MVGPNEGEGDGSSKCPTVPDEVVEEKAQITKLELYPAKMYNKIEDNWHLSNKKALFLNMSHFYTHQGIDPFKVLPVTYFVKSLDDPNFIKFKEHY